MCCIVKLNFNIIKIITNATIGIYITHLTRILLCGFLYNWQNGFINVCMAVVYISLTLSVVVSRIPIVDPLGYNNALRLGE